MFGEFTWIGIACNYNENGFFLGSPAPNPSFVLVRNAVNQMKYLSKPILEMDNVTVIDQEEERDEEEEEEDEDEEDDDNDTEKSKESDESEEWINFVCTYWKGII